MADDDDLTITVMTSTEEVGAVTPAAPAESPTSRFTAVNGVKEQAGPVGPALNGNGSGRRGSDERSNGQPRVTPPGQEKLTITTTTTTQREDWMPPANGERHPYQPSHQHLEGESSHKRKRSGSIEQGSSSASTYHTHGLPSASTAKQTPITGITEHETPKEDAPRGPGPRDSYVSETQYRQYIPSPEGNREGVSDPWNSRHYGQHAHLTSDEQIGEALRRASQNMDAQRGNYHSPEQDDRSANPYDPYGHDRREMSAQSDPKERKRNFSNRTKTGCMTCRRRKKKCDETKPECKLINIPLTNFFGLTKCRQQLYEGWICVLRISTEGSVAKD